MDPSVTGPNGLYEKYVKKLFPAYREYPTNQFIPIYLSLIVSQSRYPLRHAAPIPDNIYSYLFFSCKVIQMCLSPKSRPEVSHKEKMPSQRFYPTMRQCLRECTMLTRIWAYQGRWRRLWIALKMVVWIFTNTTTSCLNHLFQSQTYINLNSSYLHPAMKSYTTWGCPKGVLARKTSL